MSEKRVGECRDYAGMICRRFYPGKSACQQFGGDHRCLLDLREAEIQKDTTPMDKTVTWDNLDLKWA